MAKPRVLAVAPTDVGEVPLIPALADSPAFTISLVEPERALPMLRHYDLALLVHHPHDDWIPPVAEHRGKFTPDTVLVVVNIPHEPHIVLHYLMAHLDGYLYVDDSLARLFEVIEVARRGELAVDPDTAALIAQEVNRLHRRLDDLGVSVESGAALEQLTRREHEVLGLMASGLMNREIAEQLSIELGTVKNHVHGVLAKLGVRHRQQAARVFRSPTEEDGQ